MTANAPLEWQTSNSVPSTVASLLASGGISLARINRTFFIMAGRSLVRQVIANNWFNGGFPARASVQFQLWLSSTLSKSGAVSAPFWNSEYGLGVKDFVGSFEGELEVQTG